MKITKSESSGREIVLYVLAGISLVALAVGWAVFAPDTPFPVGLLAFVGNTAILFGMAIRQAKKQKLLSSWQLWAVLVAALLVHSTASFLIIREFTRPITILMLLYFVEYPIAGLVLDLLGVSLRSQNKSDSATSIKRP